MDKKKLVIYIVGIPFFLLLTTWFLVVVVVAAAAKQQHIPTSLRIDTYGDSITEQNYQSPMYYYLKQRNVESQITNYGIGGQTTREVVDRVVFNGNLIVIMAGTNDIIPGYTVDDILVQYKRLNETSFFILCSIPPVAEHVINSKSITDNILRINKELSVTYEPFCDIHRHLTGFDNRYYLKGISRDDGIHLNDRGKEILGQAIGQCIIRYFYKWIKIA